MENENIKLLEKTLPTSLNWVLFENGTYVVLDTPEKVKELALEKLTEWRQISGDSIGDFVVSKTEFGYIVNSEHPQVFAFLTFEQASDAEGDFTESQVGILGKLNINADAENRKIIHVQLSV